MTVGKVDFWKYSSGRQKMVDARQRQQATMTISRISLVQRWILDRCGIMPVLLIEPGAERNRVLLRISWDGSMLVAEVGKLSAFRIKEPRAEQGAVLALFEAVG